MKLSVVTRLLFIRLDAVRNLRTAHAKTIRSARNHYHGVTSTAFWLRMVRKSHRWLAEAENRLEAHLETCLAQ